MRSPKKQKIHNKYTLREIEEIKEKFYHLLKDSNDGIVLHDLDGKIIDSNHRLEEYLGYSKEEMLQMHIKDLHPPNEEKPKVKRMDLIKKNGLYQFERYFKTKSGEILEAEITARMLNIRGEQFVQSLVRDITEEKKNLRKIETLSKFSEENPNPVIRVNNSCRVEYANKASNELMQMLQIELGDLIPTDLKIKLKHFKEVAETVNHQRSFEYNIEDRIYLITLSFLNDTEQVYIYGQDITARKRHEQELKILNQELSDHIQELKEFAYIISHNLRAPVANILGLINLLSKDIDDQLKEEIKNSLHIAGKNLDTIVKDLNDILVIKNSEIDQKEAISFDDLVKEVTQNLAKMIESANANINIDFSHVPIIQSNKAYLYSIFQNIIENALKYRSPNRPLNINISSIRTNGKVGITFKDNGLGIDIEKNKEHLFGLYKKFHRQSKGKGIGLYLVKNQVEALNGNIEVDSVVDQGTTFKVFIDQSKKETILD